MHDCFALSLLFPADKNNVDFNTRLMAHLAGTGENLSIYRTLDGINKKNILKYNSRASVSPKLHYKKIKRINLNLLL